MTLVHPAFLMGFRFGDWLDLLKKKGFDLFYLPRVLVTTPFTMATSILARADRAIMASARVDERLWRSPLFLLGQPRSGTTQLLYLFSQHGGLVAPTRLEAYNPNSFMSLLRLGVDRLHFLQKKSDRGLDKVEVGWNMPEEDDFAIFALSGIRGLLWRAYPTEWSPLEIGEYFTEETRDLAETWKAALIHFTRKLVAQHKTRLVLKSPSHSTKIPEILEVFPEARFVTIFREPLAHFRSYRAMLDTPGTGWGELRRRPHLENKLLLELNERQLKRYFDTRQLIPKGNLVEIRHEDLNANPADVLSSVFEQLRIEGWDRFRGQLASEWDGNYRKNTHPDLPEDLQLRIRQAYAPLYDRGIYR